MPYRSHPTTGFMSPLLVAEHHDLVELAATRVGARLVDISADTLTLEWLEEAFGDCIVVAVFAPAHAAQDAVLAQERLPVAAGELGSLIRMLDQARVLLSRTGIHG